MTITAHLLKGVAKAKSALGPIVQSISVEKNVTTGYSASTSTVQKTTSTTSIDAVQVGWDQGEVNGTTVRADDLKLYVFPSDVADALTLRDRPTVNGIAYSIVSINPIMAGPKRVMTMLQLRK